MTYGVRSTSHVVQCTSYIVYNIWNASNTVYYVFTLHSVHCTALMYTVQWTVYSVLSKYDYNMYFIYSYIVNHAMYSYIVYYLYCTVFSRTVYTVHYAYIYIHSFKLILRINNTIPQKYLNIEWYMFYVNRKSHSISSMIFSWETLRWTQLYM